MRKKKSDIGSLKTKLDKLSPFGLVLLEQTALCLTSELPKAYSELNKLLWEAFDFGKKYRDEGGKE